MRHVTPLYVLKLWNFLYKKSNEEKAKEMHSMDFENDKKIILLVMKIGFTSMTSTPVNNLWNLPEEPVMISAHANHVQISSSLLALSQHPHPP